ncbi:MAG TPA: choice-of-anchor D domain-containing protein [Candidatus Acidoferrales bacterium]|nr:choice-of-anchor D domain-containing protein [Candidatus Acidoferrales bacterium]
MKPPIPFFFRDRAQKRSVLNIQKERTVQPLPTTGNWDTGAWQHTGPAAGFSYLWSGNVNPATVALGSAAVTATSPAQTVTICNGSISTGGACSASGATLTISAMALSGVNSGDFAFATSPASLCGGSLAAGVTCTISLTIKPSIIGPESATFTVTDSASGSPQSFSITGTGISQVSVSPTSQAFGNQRINTASSELLTAVTNNGTTTVTSLALSLTGTNASLYTIDTTSSTLGGQNNCAKVTSLAAGATCNAGVKFEPTFVGNNYVATLNIADSAAGSPQTVSLSGIGTGSNPVVPNNPSAFAVLRPLNSP